MNSLDPKPKLLATVPDLVEPIIGYRAWLVRSDLDGAGAYQLYSANKLQSWPADRPCESRCAPLLMPLLPSDPGGHRTPAPEESCNCGIHATKTLQDAGQVITGYPAPPIDAVALGSVSLWGKVVRGERGYRAQFAKARSIEEIFLPKGNDCQKAVLVLNSLSETYKLQTKAVVYVSFRPGPDVCSLSAWELGNLRQAPPLVVLAPSAQHHLPAVEAPPSFAGFIRWMRDFVLHPFSASYLAKAKTKARKQAATGSGLIRSAEPTILDDGYLLDRQRQLMACAPVRAYGLSLQVKIERIGAHHVRHR